MENFEKILQTRIFEVPAFSNLNPSSSKSAFREALNVSWIEFEERSRL